eukprot:SAG11_NODE_931_length_6499_cov_28.824219_1_plen_1551_part_00
MTTHEQMNDDDTSGREEVLGAFLPAMLGMSDTALHFMRGLSETECGALIDALLGRHTERTERELENHWTVSGLMRSPDAEPPPGYTPGDLRTAAARGELDKAIALLEAGLNANAAVEKLGGWSPLHFAAKAGHTDVIEALLKHGANALARDGDGDTPLTHARFWGCVETAAVLDAAERQAVAVLEGGGGRSPAVECVILTPGMMVESKQVPVAVGTFALYDGGGGDKARWGEVTKVDKNGHPYLRWLDDSGSESASESDDDDGSEPGIDTDHLTFCVATRAEVEKCQQDLADVADGKKLMLWPHQDEIEKHHKKERVSVLCSAPEYAINGDKIMIGLEIICEIYGEYVKFGYDWGGSSTAEGSDADPARVVPACCHSLACSCGAFRSLEMITGPVDWSNPLSVAGSMWFPKYKTKIMSFIQAEAQRPGVKVIEILLVHGGPVTQLEQRTAPRLVTGAVTDLKKKGMDIGFFGQGCAITVVVRTVEYTEFFDRFLGKLLMPNSTPSTLDLADRQIDARQAVALAWWLTTAAAVSVSLPITTVKHNPRETGRSGQSLPNLIGDAADALVAAFEENAQVKTLLGLEDGEHTLDLSKKKLDPVFVKILASEFRLLRATAAVTSLDCGANPGMVGELHIHGSDSDSDDESDQVKVPDAHADVFGVLCDSLKRSKVTELDFSSCGIGPVAVGHLGGYLREAEATSLTICGNAISGSKSYDWKYDLDLSGLTALGEAMAISTTLTSVDLSDCKISAAGLTELCKFIPSMDALVELALGSNPFGLPVLTLKPGSTTGVAVEAGVVASVDGRFGQVMENLHEPEGPLEHEPDDPLETELLWLDDHSASNVNVDQLEAVVASRDDLLEDYTHIKQLGEAISVSKVQTLSFSNCKLAAAGLAELCKFIPSMDALVELALGSNPFGLPVLTLKPGATTGHAVQKGVFASVGGRFGEVTNMEKEDGDEYVNLRWLDDHSESEYIEVANLEAVVASRDDLLEDYTHIKQLGEAISVSKVQKLDLSDCGLTAASLTSFAQSVRWAEAALEHLDVSSQNFIGEASSALVEALECSSTLESITIGGLAEAKTPSFLAQKAIPGRLTLLLKERHGSDSLDASDKGIEAGGAAVIGWWLTTAAAAGIASLTLAGNLVTDERKESYHAPDWKYDLDLSGLTALGEAMAISTTLTSVDLSDCKISAAGLTELCKFIPSMDALVELALGSNPFGLPRDDLLEDYTHIKQLGEAISKVQTLSFSGCELTLGSLTTFAQSVCWAEAAMRHLDLTQNVIGEAGSVLVEALKSSSTLESITIGGHAEVKEDRRRGIEAREAIPGVTLPLKQQHAQSSGTPEAEKKQQRAIVDMTAKEFYFKVDQVGDLLDLIPDKRAKVEAVIKLFERVLDTDELLEIVETKMDAEQRQYIEAQLGQLYRFDPKNPTGHYQINLARPFDRLLVVKMIAMSNGENDDRHAAGLIDTSQRLNLYNFRNQRINCRTKNHKFGTDRQLPTQGIFEFDYTSTFLDGKPRSPGQYHNAASKLCESFFSEPRVMPQPQFEDFTNTAVLTVPTH